MPDGRRLLVFQISVFRKALIDTVVCLTLAKWETVSGQFGGYLTGSRIALRCAPVLEQPPKLIGFRTSTVAGYVL
jgi:hypothetical protein